MSSESSSTLLLGSTRCPKILLRYGPAPPLVRYFSGPRLLKLSRGPAFLEPLPVLAIK